MAKRLLVTRKLPLLLAVLILAAGSMAFWQESAVKEKKKKGWLGVSVQELTPSLRDAMKLDLPSVTRFMLGEIDERLTRRDDLGAPFLRWTRSGHSTDRI